MKLENEFEQKIFNHIKKESDWVTVQSISLALKVHWNTCEKYLSHLEVKGLIVRKNLNTIKLYRLKEGVK